MDQTGSDEQMYFLTCEFKASQRLLNLDFSFYSFKLLRFQF